MRCLSDKSNIGPIRFHVVLFVFIGRQVIYHPLLPSIYVINEILASFFLTCCMQYHVHKETPTTELSELPLKGNSYVTRAEMSLYSCSRNTLGHALRTNL